MAYIIECKYGESVDFTGPFDSRKDAEVFLMLPIAGSFLHCQRMHTIHELIVPDAGTIDLSTVMRIVDEVKYDAKQQVIAEIARKSPRFGVGVNGNIETDFSILQQFGIVNPIATIKELRTRYPGLGLKEAKEIVEEWHARSDNMTPLWGQARKEVNQ